MQKPKFILISGIMVSLLTLSGCFPSVYKIDIQQGNIITQDMINQLRPGMTRAQVRYLMGSPLVVDPFHANRWDYIYSIQPGGGTMHQENVSLVFENNQLVGLAGDFQPGMTRDEEILGGKPQSGTTDGTQGSSTGSGSVEQQIQQDVDSAETIAVPVPDRL